MTLAFFRRHHRFFMILMILAVAMMVLMGVIYSLPRFIESWFGSGRASLVLAEVYGKPVTRGEKWSFGRRLTIAGQAAFAAYDILAHKQLDNPKLSELRAATLGGMSPFAYKLAQATRGGTAFTNDDLWAAVAVYAEARQAGFEIPDAMLKSKLEALRHYGLTPADYTTLLRRVAGGRQSVLFEAWRQDMALTSYVNFIARMPRVIGGEVEQRFRRLDEKVRVALVVLKGDDFIKQVKSLSPEELKRQFETHKKFLPGGGGPGGIGYKIPEKVEFEYLVTGPDTFADQVKISDEDIAKYYDENKDLEFVVEPEKKEDDKKEGGEKSDDEKKEKPEKPKVTYRPLDEVKDRIRTALHDQRSRASAAAHMVSISNELTAIIARRTKINFETFADGTKVRLVRPKGFRQREELAEVKGIGEATSEGGEKFPDYALSITSLKAVTGQPALLDVGQPSGVLVDETGNQYIFRCTAVRKARVPASIDEVREAVEGDVRYAEAFQLAQKTARDLLAEAKKTSLEEAAKKRGLKLITPEPFPRQQLNPLVFYGYAVGPRAPDVEAVGRNRFFVDACFALVGTKKKFALAALQRSRIATVAELKEVLLPSRSEFEKQKPLIGMLAERDAQRAVMMEFLKTTNIHRRAQVVILVKSEQTKDEKETPEKTN